MKWIFSLPGSFLGLVNFNLTVPNHYLHMVDLNRKVMLSCYSSSQSCLQGATEIQMFTTGGVHVCTSAYVVCMWDKDVPVGVVDLGLIVTTAGMLPCCNTVCVCVFVCTCGCA